jgi:hypothetical protein
MSGKLNEWETLTVEERAAVKTGVVDQAQGFVQPKIMTVYDGLDHFKQMVAQGTQFE